MGILYCLNKNGTGPASFKFLCPKCDDTTKHIFCYLVDNITEEYLGIETLCLKCKLRRKWPMEKSDLFNKLIEEEGDLWES